MSAVYRPMSISKKLLLSASAFVLIIHIFFKPSHSSFDFSRKICILGEYLYVSHTLFILYLEGNHTLFGEKLYFIWKFSSGNTDFYQMNKYNVNVNLDASDNVIPGYEPSPDVLTSQIQKLESAITGKARVRN